MNFFNKLKQVFKGRADAEENTAESVIEENKSSLDENIVYPENIESEEDIAEKKIDPDALYVPDLGKTDNNDNINENLNLLNAGDENVAKETESQSENSSEPNYDAEIEKLLKQDAEIELEDVDYEYINDISVYDTLRNEKDEVIKEINEELQSENSSDNENNIDNGINKMYIILIAVIGVLIIAVIAFIIIVASAKPTKKVSNGSKSAVIDFNKYKSNNANYIYLSQKKDFDEQKFELSKMLVDSKATLFYFNNKFDIQKYNIILSDDKGVVYGMDLSFIQNMASSDEDEEKSTILRFEPLNINARSINLSLYNVESGKGIEFKFDFNGNIEETPVKYIFDKEISSKNSDVKINIDNMVFSSAGSSVNYTIQSAGKGFSIVQEKGKNGSIINLEENASAVKKLKKYPSMYTFNSGNIILGRMDFDSIENLNSKIYLTFSNIFKSYAVNRDISANNLSSEKKPLPISVGNYNVIIEGVNFQNNGVILVFHGENKNVKFDSKKPNANRVEVRLDAEIVSTNSSGMEIILNGSCRSAAYGTDMVFPISKSNRDLFYNLGVNNITIRIKSVLIKTEDLKFEYDLSKGEVANNQEKEKASSDVIDAFKGRLAYKSGEKSIEAVMGFDERLVKSGDVLSEYAPMKTVERAQYSAQIISSSLLKDKFYAVVQDVWKAPIGIDEETYFSRTHKIVAQKGEYSWKIIEDNIIK